MGKIIYIQKTKEREMENIFDVAKWFLSMESMTHLKLQKLCYYAQAWHLAVYKKRLVDENFQAWVHGPVSPTLYARYRHWGWHDIIKYEGQVKLKRKTIEFLNIVYGLYGKYKGWELEELTHKEEPWINARKGIDPKQSCTNVIRDKDMEIFYRNELREALEKNG